MCIDKVVVEKEKKVAWVTLVWRSHVHIENNGHLNNEKITWLKELSKVSEDRNWVLKVLEKMKHGKLSQIFDQAETEKRAI